MAKVTDGASRRFSDSKANQQQVGADRAAAASVQGASQKEQKAVAKQAEKSQAKKENKENEDMKFVKGEVHFNTEDTFTLDKLSCIKSKTTKIGMYGRARSNDTLPKISKEIYRDEKLWKIIAVANNLSKDSSLSSGQIIYVPDLIIISSNDTDSVSFVSINKYALEEKVQKKRSLMYTNVVLENPTCTIGPVKKESDSNRGDFPNQMGPFSGGDVGSTINTVLSQSNSIGKANKLIHGGNVSYKFAKGTLSMTRRVTQSASQFKATFVKAGFSGCVLTSAIFGIYDGAVTAANTGNMPYGLYTATKSTVNGLAAGAIGVGAGIFFVEVLTPPGWVVLAIEIGVSIISLYGINEAEAKTLTNWEKSTFKLKK